MDDVTLAMARLRKALKRRMRADEAREKRRAGPKRKADGALASFDTRGLAALLRPALEFDGRGWAACAAEIGVTAPDLSRVMAGQDISAGKVFAICDWLRRDARQFFRPVRGKRATFRGFGRRAKASSECEALPPLRRSGKRDVSREEH